jgi:hypothetical protein
MLPDQDRYVCTQSYGSIVCVRKQLPVLINDGSAQAKTNEQALASQLLVSIYANLNEPDALYAAVHGETASGDRDASEQLTLARHEHDWRAVVAHHDNALSVLTLGTPPVAAAVSAPPTMTRAGTTHEHAVTRHSVGLASALRYTGQHHTLRTFLSGVAQQVRCVTCAAVARTNARCTATRDV